MRICALSCAAALAAVPASAQDSGLVVDLLPGHAIYHESEREAGVVMAISITPEQGTASDLMGLCEELRVAAGLPPEHGEDLALEVVFVVPYKGMAVEGYYLPADDTSDSEALVPGNAVAKATLDGIVTRAGIPSRVLDEVEVEHEVSCELGEPAWLLRWEDVQLVGGEQPDAVIDRAYRRFMITHRSVVDHAMGISPAAGFQPLVAMRRTPAPGVVAPPVRPEP
jgi:hypothetical protein